MVGGTAKCPAQYPRNLAVNWPDAAAHGDRAADILHVPYMSPIVLLVLIVTLIDVAKADEALVRGLPKTLWLLLVIFVPIAGAFAWFIAGRPDTVNWNRPNRNRSAFPEYDRPGRQILAHSEADDEFLKRCRERAEQQRRAYREQQRRGDGSDDRQE